jgi:hypothetical protein
VETVSDGSVIVQNKPSVVVRKPSGLTFERVYGFSVNFCDKTTWYHDATKISDEAVGTGDGVATAFQLDHGTASASPDAADERIVDLSHGKVSDENDILPSGETLYRDMGSGYSATGSLSAYVPVVKLDGVEQVERSYGSATGGDYTINYAAGTINFFSAPGNGVAVVCTYWYVPKAGVPYIRLVAPTNKQYSILRVEVQSTTDVELDGSIIMNVYAGAAPPNGVAVRRPTIVKNIHDLINWAYGSFDQIPAQGGATRGLGLPVNIHRVEYISEVPLLSSQLMYMQVHTDPNTEFTGTWASVVIYGMEEDEPA